MNPTQERWLPIPGYEGYYEVSDYGRVRSVDRLGAVPHIIFRRRYIHSRFQFRHVQCE